MTRPDQTTTPEQAAAIRRIAMLQQLREQAQAGRREAVVPSIEAMLRAELRLLQLLKETETSESQPPTVVASTGISLGSAS